MCHKSPNWSKMAHFCRNTPFYFENSLALQKYSFFKEHASKKRKKVAPQQHLKKTNVYYKTGERSKNDQKRGISCARTHSFFIYAVKSKIYPIFAFLESKYVQVFLNFSFLFSFQKCFLSANRMRFAKKGQKLPFFESTFLSFLPFFLFFFSKFAETTIFTLFSAKSLIF